MFGKDELATLKGFLRVYIRHVDYLETEITNLLKEFDIENDKHKEKLFPYKTKYQSKKRFK